MTLSSPVADTVGCQIAAASLDISWTLGASVTTCERVITLWRGEEAAAQSLNLERAVWRIAVSPVGEFVAVAFTNGAIWMYHVAYPTRPIVLADAGPGVSWLGFSGDADAQSPSAARPLRLIAVRAQREVAIYPVGTDELERVLDQRAGRWQLDRAECEDIFGDAREIGACAETGFWQLVTRSLFPPAGRTP
jgi:hypothetical protein